MAAFGFVVLREVRGHWRSLLLLVSVVAIGGGAAAIALETSQRTESVYERFVEAQQIGDAIVNPSLITAEVDAALRALPGTTWVAASSLMGATLDVDGPAGSNLGEDLQVSGSTDGRYIEVDRVLVSAGRLPTGANELLVNQELAEAHGLKVGQQLDVLFVNGQAEHTGDGSLFREIGREPAVLVGIGTFPDEALPDDLYPRQRALLSADITERYGCLPTFPSPDASLEASVEALSPSDCAQLYRYYSFGLAGGAADTTRFLSAVAALQDELNAGFPELREELDTFGYQMFPTATSDEAQRVERSLRPSTTVWLLFAWTAAIATVVVAALVAARLLRRSVPTMRHWHRLGMSTSAVVIAASAPILLAVTLGTIVATLLAVAGSTVGLVGRADTIDVDPQRRLSAGVGLGAMSMLVLVAILVLVTAWTVTRLATRSSVRPHAPGRLTIATGRLGSPVMGEGVKAALGGSGQRGPLLVIGTAVVATAAAAGALVFGSNLDRLVDDPAEYGWPWDLAAVTGSGYGSVNRDEVDHVLDTTPGVERWGLAGFGFDIAVDGLTVPSIFALHGFDQFELPLVAGNLPRNADEVALGSATAAALDAEVGDTVVVSAPFGDRESVVSGLVVMPAIGPYLADRAGLGTGLLVPRGAFPEAEADEIDLASFVVIGAAPGTSTGELIEALADSTPLWDLDGRPAQLLASPVRPPQITNAAEMNRGPRLLAVFLGLGMSIALGLAVAISVRARQRDLAILQSLGVLQRQLRATVFVQAVTIAVAGVVVGTPIGIIVGRTTWRSFADQLGVPDDEIVPLTPLLLAGTGIIAVGFLAAWWPSRRVRAISPAVALRNE